MQIQQYVELYHGVNPIQLTKEIQKTFYHDQPRFEAAVRAARKRGLIWRGMDGNHYIGCAKVPVKF